MCVFLHTHARDAPNWVAERLGASSRRPRHPFPALMAGETPGRVPVYTALTLVVVVVVVVVVQALCSARVSIHACVLCS